MVVLLVQTQTSNKEPPVGGGEGGEERGNTSGFIERVEEGTGEERHAQMGLDLLN